MKDIENLAKDYVLAKENVNQEGMKEIKDKLKSLSIDRDAFIDSVEKEEAKVKTEKARKIEEKNKHIDESYENVISKIIDQIIIKTENNIVVRYIQKLLVWISKILRLRLKAFIERRLSGTFFGFLEPYANQVTNEIIDSTFEVLKSFFNLLAHTLINGDYWTIILKILKKNWDANCDSGTATRTYCIAQKLVAAIGYTILSCLHRSFMILNQVEKDNIN